MKNLTKRNSNLKDRKKKAKVFMKSLKTKIKEAEESDSSSRNNDHFIPRFLLRNFGVQESSGRPTHIFKYKRGDAFDVNKKPSAIKSTASREGHFDISGKKTKEADNLYDRIYSRAIESIAVPVIKKLKTIESDGYFDDAELNILCTFVSYLYVSTPSFRAQIKHYIIYLLEKGFIKVEDLNESGIRDIFLNNKFDIKIEDLRKFKPKKFYDIDFYLKTHLVLISSEFQIRLSKQIFDRDITILESNEGSFFLGDNPVFAFKQGEKVMWPFGYEFKDDQYIYLPISPSKCLCFGEVSNIVKPAIVCNLDGDKNELVALVNYQSVFRAEDEVYFNSNQEVIQKSLNKSKKRHSFGES